MKKKMDAASDDSMLVEHLLSEEHRRHQPADMSVPESDDSESWFSAIASVFTFEIVITYATFSGLCVFLVVAIEEFHEFCRELRTGIVLPTGIYVSDYGCDAPVLFDWPILCASMTCIFFGTYFLELVWFGESDVSMGKNPWLRFWLSILLPLNLHSTMLIGLDIGEIRVFMPAYLSLNLFSLTASLVWYVLYPVPPSVVCSTLIVAGYVLFIVALSAFGDVHTYPILESRVDWLAALVIYPLQQLVIGATMSYVTATCGSSFGDDAPCDDSDELDDSCV